MACLFTTQRLKIRNLNESDLDAFHLYRSNPEVTRYQGFDTYTKEQAKSFIAEHQNKLLIVPGEWVQYGIENISTGELIGDCAIYLHASDSRIAELGISISHLHQRQGYAKETMLGLMNFLFSNKGIHRIEETVDAENLASIRMLESLSYRKEAHFIENTFFKGKWGSEYQFAMLHREWDILLKNKLVVF
ncbi:MAG TPA: GNAT family N-acetyltransferase [Puia sp.]|nr:GNAT family N-acetyltransferase [Puia sp.]